MQCRRGLLLLPEALVGCSDSECRRDYCSEVEEISAACSDFCSDAGEICKVGDSCSIGVWWPEEQRSFQRKTSVGKGVAAGGRNKGRDCASFRI